LAIFCFTSLQKQAFDASGNKKSQLKGWLFNSWAESEDYEPNSPKLVFTEFLSLFC